MLGKRRSSGHLEFKKRWAVIRLLATLGKFGFKDIDILIRTIVQDDIRW